MITQLAESSYYTKRGILLLADTAMLIFSLWAAVSLRLEEIWPDLWHNYSWLFVFIPIISIPIFIRLGMYRAVIRYTSLDALWVICVAVFNSSLLLTSLLLIAGFSGFPRSVPLIYFFLSFLILGGSRLTFRNIYSQFYLPPSEGKRVLIYGAGSSGRQMVIAFQNSSEFHPVCFVDNSKKLQGRDLSGLPIYAPEQVAELVEKYRVDLILLAMPSESKKRKKEILQFLEQVPVEVKSLPSLDELVTGNIGVKDIQDIRIEDLLGRDPIPPQKELLDSCITDKVVMVTGAGGSIGSELCRQIAEIHPKRLILFERSEFALYTIESEMHSRFGESIEIVSILGSVTNKRRILAVIKALEVKTVYHAAAYKHVPLVEYNPIEGVRNNVFGTLMAAEAALEGNVETFVLISTDKAVRPTNIMGASKRLAELILQAFAKRNDITTRFTMVRFGNVLGSSGSVVPLFKKQIKDGGPVTVTHPDVVRYFMTTREAVQLVLQAGAMGHGGDVFVLDMGEPVKISDLAKKMIYLSGHKVRDQENPHGDIAIEYIGLRAGEKLFEELLVGHNVVGTDHPMIMRALETFIPWSDFQKVLMKLDKASNCFNFTQIREILLQYVEGYCPQCDIVDHIWKSDKSVFSIPGKQPQTFPLKEMPPYVEGFMTKLHNTKKKLFPGKDVSAPDNN